MRATKLLEKIDNIAKKSAMDSSILTGGTLAEDKADELISLLVKQNDLLSKVRVDPLNADKGYVNTINVSPRSLRSGDYFDSNTNLTEVTPNSHEYNCVETVLAFDLKYSVLENIITNATVNNKLDESKAEKQILEEMTKAFANDLADLAWNGNDGSADNFLKINDGWLQLLIDRGEANIVDITPIGAGELSDIFSAMMKAMPTMYRRKDLIKFLLSANAVEDYIDVIQATSNRILTRQDKLTSRQADIIADPYLPADNHVLVDPKDLAMGVSRKMRIDRNDNGRKRAIEYTITMKTDFETTDDSKIVYAYAVT